MKCPRCKNELPEGCLYCDECGYEIRIVPDFEPEVEENLNNALQNIMEDIDEKETSDNWEDIDDFAEEERIGFLALFLRICKWKPLGYGILSILCVVALYYLGSYLWVAEEKLTFNDYYEQAMAAYDSADYHTAINAMDNALKLDPDYMDGILIKAECYMKVGRIEEAIEVYTELMGNPKYATVAAESIADYYLLVEDFTSLNKFLRICDIDSVLALYDGYYAVEPEFFPIEGNYEEEVEIVLSTGYNGKIYYTTDGTTPTTESNVYTGPIKLESGITKVQAFFVNELNQVSNIVSAKYAVDSELLPVPIIDIAEGDYSAPEYITVTYPLECYVYYTVDGTTPTSASELYNKRLPMRMGNTTYQFICVDPEGVASEPVTLNTNLSFHWVVSVEDSVKSLVNYLVTLGKLADNTGKVNGRAGHLEYECDSAFVDQEMIFYLVIERYVDTLGNKFLTGNKYAIDSGSGLLYYVSTDANGYLSVSRM